MTKRELAIKYINDQMEVIKSHGGVLNLSDDRINEAIRDAERTFESMSKVSNLAQKDRHIGSSSQAFLAIKSSYLSLLRFMRCTTMPIMSIVSASRELCLPANSATYRSRCFTLK